MQSALILCILTLAGLALHSAIFNELQAWDESLYAIRAKYIAQGGNILDQTSVSPGGLYSSVHPPLFIWINALFVSIVGNIEIAYRIGSLLFSFAICFFIYKSVKDKTVSLISCALLISAPLFAKYSIQAQLDIALTFCTFLGIYNYYIYKVSGAQNRLIFASIALGMGLMSKAAFGGLAIASVVIFEIINCFLRKSEKRKYARNLIKSLSIITIISAPWHIYMLAVHGWDFINFFAFYHIYQRMTGIVENNTKSLGYLFYLNQLLVIAPFGFLILQNILKDLKSEKLIFYIYLAVNLAVISISKSKMQTYLLPILPILVLLTAYRIQEYKEEKVESAFGFLTLAILIWSFSQNLRDYVQANLFEISVIISAITILIAIYFAVKFIKIKYIHFGFLCALVLCVKAFIYPPNFVKNEMSYISEYYYSNTFSKIVLAEPNQYSYTSNPAFSFYFNGLDIKKDSSFKFHSDEKELKLTMDSLNGTTYIVLIKDKNGNCESILNGVAKLIFSGSRYSAYEFSR